MDAVEANSEDYRYWNPVARVSTSGAGTRTVVVSLPPSMPSLKTVQAFFSSSDAVDAPVAAAVTSGPEPNMTDKLDQLDGRLRNVENELSGMRVDLSHKPTKLEMWKALVVVVLPVAGAVIGILTWVMKGLLAPLMPAG